MNVSTVAQDVQTAPQTGTADLTEHHTSTHRGVTDVNPVSELAINNNRCSEQRGAFLNRLREDRKEHIIVWLLPFNYGISLGTVA